MMRIEINFLDNYVYEASSKKIPIIVTLSSDQDVEIADKIDLLQILLLKGEEEITGTGSVGILGSPNSTFLLSKNKPHFLLYDLYAGYDDEDYEVIVSGIYQISVIIKVYVKKEFGEFKNLKLEAQRSIPLK